MIDVAQIGIALTGAVAVFLTQSSTANLRRYACLFGMVGQPFWFMAAWKAGQMGVLFVSFLYALAWAKGVHTHWFRKEPSHG